MLYRHARVREGLEMCAAVTSSKRAHRLVSLCQLNNNNYDIAGWEAHNVFQDQSPSCCSTYYFITNATQLAVPYSTSQETSTLIESDNQEKLERLSRESDGKGAAIPDPNTALQQVSNSSSSSHVSLVPVFSGGGETESNAVLKICSGSESKVKRKFLEDKLIDKNINFQDQNILHQPYENLFPSQVKTLQMKFALNSGIEHVNTVGKVRKARKPLAPCKANCIRCEKPKLDENERDQISKSFWSLKDHGQQWLFIYDAVSLSATKSGSKGTKAFNRYYSFLVDGKRRKICKTMFKCTLNISDSWIVSALSHCCDKNLVIPDQRGKHRSLNKNEPA
ncbi:Protein prickle [Frankliniella fusca]|uniref:Protein prickle n=1 Tax=Frankliniella fusca TaxID=407009 RepID=A0AAE1L774_9NEOP|nr:Protein prickle [Frankliniella fusca]